MSHTYAQNTLHVVFSTKERRKAIGKGFAPKIHAYIAGICNHHNIFVHAIGGTEDHIHLLIQLPTVLALAKALTTIKANSSKWAHESGHKLGWQEGYGAFSVSASVVPAVIRYIRGQEAHHRKMNFSQEFITLLKKHHIQYDPKFVFG
jgi:REP element-mobilizing transposase RayT